MISIIIPAYNASISIKRCVESIVNSAPPELEYEIIIVDDGSVDDTYQECKALCDRYPWIHCYHKENEGVSVARNFGLEKARGEYISFVDSDDTVLPDYLPLINKYSANADITFFGFIFYDLQTGKEEIKKPKFYAPTNNPIEIDKTIAYLLKNENANFFGFTWSKVFKAEIIKNFNIRFIPGLKIKEDELFTLEYCKYIQSIQVIDQYLYRYCVSANSLSHFNPEIDYSLLANSYKPYIDRTNLHDLKTIFLHLYLCNKYGELKGFIREGKPKKIILKKIRNDVLPNISQDKGISWYPLVKMIPLSNLKSLLIYYILKR